MTDAAPAPAEIKSGAVPYFAIKDGHAAVEFYKKAFAAEVAAIMPTQDGTRLMHAHLYINGASVMMSDCFPEHGVPWKEPQGFNVMLPVDSADAWADRAIAAGCTVKMPVELQFWGDRYGSVEDPFGNVWAFSSRG